MSSTQQPATAPNEPIDPGPTAQTSRRGWSTGWLERYSGLFIWAALIVIFGILEPDTFLTSQTWHSVLSAQAITAMLALGLLLPLAAGVFDLSIASTMGLAVMLCAWLQSVGHIAPVLAIVLTLIAGVVVGLVNAFVVVRLGVDSFIATLGASSILLALMQVINGGQQIVQGIPTSFTDLANKQVFSIALPFFYMLLLALVLWYVTEYRQVGRYTYATGSNPEAARLAGVRTDRLRTLSLVASALIASITGVIFLATVGSASPDSGSPYLLPAFAGAFLGATQIKPGRANVPGTLIAVYLLATGVKGLQLAGAQVWVNDMFNGVALIVAVAVAVRAGRRRRA
ncbi:MAG TPA: ABC transporter permease [Solirubrobacteraceae bacterium]|jgi:ribose transport system permease protein